MLFFNAIFLLMAISINRNVRLQQENQLLSMQQQRYESLKAAIEEARQARHDLRHQLCQLAALAEEGNLEKIKAYLSGAVSRIPSLEMHFCENRAADSVVGYYCALAKRENIPYSVQIDLPECLPVDEINLCLVLSNLLENALEASLRTAPARRRIKLTAYLHGNSLALIQVENTYSAYSDPNADTCSNGHFLSCILLEDHASFHPPGPERFSPSFLLLECSHQRSFSRLS